MLFARDTLLVLTKRLSKFIDLSKIRWADFGRSTQLIKPLPLAWEKHHHWLNHTLADVSCRPRLFISRSFYFPSGLWSGSPWSHDRHSRSPRADPHFQSTMPKRHEGEGIQRPPLAFHTRPPAGDDPRTQPGCVRGRVATRRDVVALVHTRLDHQAPAVVI